MLCRVYAVGHHQSAHLHAPAEVAVQPIDRHIARPVDGPAVLVMRQVRPRIDADRKTEQVHLALSNVINVRFGEFHRRQGVTIRNPQSAIRNQTRSPAGRR